MKPYNAKQNILGKIKQALAKPVPAPFTHSQHKINVFKPVTQDAGIEFAENFSALQGRFAYCANTKELTLQLQHLFTSRQWQHIYCSESALKQLFYTNGLGIDYSDNLATCDASITSCEFLVARTGTIVMASAQQSGRTTSVYAPVHICVAYTSQLAPDLGDALVGIKHKYNKLPSLITFASGPSRTADIEKTLVVGIHGPKEVFCFLVED